MPGITIKKIPDDRYQRLVETGRTHHRSLAKEIVVALERHVGKPTQDKQALLERIRAVRERYQPTISAESLLNAFKTTDIGACLKRSSVSKQD